ncbi:MAG: nucleotide exchange factor GrpE [Ruminococcaceae bacterium]|nr:nucleotide exchange factor GrpE [Oscillospiraceae bacterium]
MEKEQNTVDTATEAEQTTPPKEEKKKATKAQVTDLEQKLAAAQEELAQVKDQYQRMLAEYANYKRRTEQEKEQIGAFTKAELLTGLLVSLDNMEKAIEAPAGDEYKTGVDLVLKQFMEALHKLGLEEIEAENAPFDPNVHNAVMREDADGVEPDTVTAVFQKGYKIGERVLRPAMVKVAN